MIGSFRDSSIDLFLMLMTSMKNVISWKTISRIGTRFGSAISLSLRLAIDRPYYLRFVTTSDPAVPTAPRRLRLRRRGLGSLTALVLRIELPKELVGREHRRGRD